MTDPDTTQLAPRAREGTPFGQLMREKRELRGLSQSRAVLLSGISQARWRQLENDTDALGNPKPQRPRANTVKLIAACLQWDQNDALRAAGLEPDDTPPSTTSFPVTFLGLLHELPSAKRAYLLGVMRDLQTADVPEAEAS